MYFIDKGITSFSLEKMDAVTKVHGIPINVFFCCRTTTCENGKSVISS